jgi:hypothetical protein
MRIGQIAATPPQALAAQSVPAAPKRLEKPLTAIPKSPAFMVIKKPAKKQKPKRSPW